MTFDFNTLISPDAMVNQHFTSHKSKSKLQQNKTKMKHIFLVKLDTVAMHSFEELHAEKMAARANFCPLSEEDLIEKYYNSISYPNLWCGYLQKIKIFSLNHIFKSYHLCSSSKRLYSSSTLKSESKGRVFLRDNSSSRLNECIHSSIISPEKCLG